MIKALMIGALTLALGCANSNDSSPASGEGAQSETLPVLTSMLGTWSQTCQANSNYSQKSSLKIDATNIEVTGQVFVNDNVCTTAPYAVSRYIMAYSFGNLVAGTNNVDYATVGVKMRYGNAVAVSGANASAYCGFTDWQLNVEKDISGLSCTGINQDAVGSHHYSIFKIQNGNLYLGQTDATHDGNSVAARPTNFDPIYYIKQ
jgi:hypothetical protein